MSNWDAGLDMLKEELSYLYLQESDYRSFVREVGLGEQNIRFTGKAITDWSNILEEAQKKGMIVDIIGKARHKYPERFVLQVAECYINCDVPSHMKVWSVGLSESARELFECHSKVWQIMQILICWNDTLVMTRKTVPDLSVSPEDYMCIQSLINQLKISLQKVYQLVANSDLYQPALGTGYSEFRRDLSVTKQQTNDVIKKIRQFQDGYSDTSLVSLKLEEYIQEKLVDIVQNLQSADAWMSMWRHQFLEAGISSDKVIKATKEDFSGTEAASDPVNTGSWIDSHQTDKPPVSNTPVAEASCDSVAIDPEQVTRDLLNQALFQFYDTDSTGFTKLCSELADEFRDRKLRRSNLKKGKLEEQITHLLDYCEDKAIYDKAVNYIICKVSGFKETLNKIRSSQKNSLNH